MGLSTWRQRLGFAWAALGHALRIKAVYDWLIVYGLIAFISYGATAVIGWLAELHPALIFFAGAPVAVVATWVAFYFFPPQPKPSLAPALAAPAPPFRDPWASLAEVLTWLAFGKAVTGEEMYSAPVIEDSKFDEKDFKRRIDAAGSIWAKQVSTGRPTVKGIKEGQSGYGTIPSDFFLASDLEFHEWRSGVGVPVSPGALMTTNYKELKMLSSEVLEVWPKGAIVV